MGVDIRDRSWKKEPGETLACLIIDDPLLKKRYGCLNYSRLLDEMKQHSFFTEIAFIPWNYRRSDIETVRLFAENPNYYSICVHGCNHMSNEFGSLDYQRLSLLSSTALWRMEKHKDLTGLPYDPVFVFPQGRFSSVAIQALKDNGFRAAFNSTIRAIDRDEPDESEYKKPAARIYYDFPLFLRRYPHAKTKLADDIANGRPIVIVEHHGAFRHGYKGITDTVDWINSFGKVRWTSLLRIVDHYSTFKQDETNPKTTPNLPSLSSFDLKTALRRFCSEIRDNYVERSDILTKLYRMVRV